MRPAQPPIQREAGLFPCVPRLRMSGAVPLLPHVPSMRGQGQLYFHFVPCHFYTLKANHRQDLNF